ncbi:hypothetical protein BU24DRAFT_398561 [Aaosphaeria arxii CBS 175.79]|uniref:Uncharacterized protein n=1 Tax=Aaosphaeria arxii CBS 175.79 TaxID=1450172 RepID=A0A6A5XFQ5_9PLEO|nr:uncharacterized protein BU24DRAFT_398561 [Aaosphaeria arxii CBS 175.79]KAF2011770.1 hypothetical protein BU24DRAFT_398561 [Aaosphaeria arxii CBS 175.79]
MATLRSLGLHRPAALQYLIREGILDEDCKETEYKWDTYHDGMSTDVIDEIITTQYHVAWSRGGVVRKVFSFEVEQEKVLQALLTWFPTEDNTVAASSSQESSEESEDGVLRTSLSGRLQESNCQDNSDRRLHFSESKSRALVVFLKSQAHVFFLDGSNHVVNLPFEVERAFPATKGVLVQRRIPRFDAKPSTPTMPSAPPNSFLTNTHMSQSFSQSHLKTPRRHRHGSSLGLKQGTSMKSTPMGSFFLEDLVMRPAIPMNDGLPRIFSFTDPLSEFGLVVNVTTASEHRGFLSVSATGHRRLEPIDKSEEMIYISAQNELKFDESGNDSPLLLAVTMNHDTNTFTIWSAAYLEPKSISTSRKNHVLPSAKKARRRSSYGPTAPGTGATTPAVRGADRMRESFGGAGRSKPQPPPSFNVSSRIKERLSDQAVEDALTSQLNPDFDMSRQPKESRRVSSLLSRAELSNSFDKSAFQDLATQRSSLGGSFGASQRSRHSIGHERTSFGGFSHSRNRASTPGSVTSRLSFGQASIDDTFEDMDEDTLDTLEDYDELDDLFSPPEAGSERDPIDGLRKELVMTVIAEIPAQKHLKPHLLTLKEVFSTSQAPPKVFTAAAPFNSAALHERKICLYIVHASLLGPIECELSVTRKRPSTTMPQIKSTTAPPRYACVPKFVKVQTLSGVIDVTKLVDGHTERILCLRSANPPDPDLIVTAGWGTHLPIKFAVGSLKLFNPYAFMRDGKSRATAGLRRTITAPHPLQYLPSALPGGTFDVVDGESRRHRLQMHLKPRNPWVAHLFKVLSKVLSNHIGDFLLEIWWNIRRTMVDNFESSFELDWAAFATTLFCLVVPFVDERSMKAKKNSKQPRQRRSTGTPASLTRPDEIVAESSAWDLMNRRQNARSAAKPLSSTPWCWTQSGLSPSVSSSRTSRRSLTVNPSPSNGNVLSYYIAEARRFLQTPVGKASNDQWRHLSPSERQDLRISCASEVVVTLHLLREEVKLNILSSDESSSHTADLAPILAQLGHWLRWESWGYKQGAFYDLDGGSSELWAYEESSLVNVVKLHSQPWKAPPSILEWISSVLRSQTYTPFPTVAILIRKSKASPHSSVNIDEIISSVTPRTVALDKFFQHVDKLSNPRRAVELIEHCGITPQVLATLPEAVRAPLMEAIMNCQANPPTTWPRSLLKLVQREDLDLTLKPNEDSIQDSHQGQSNSAIGSHANPYSSSGIRDVHTICQSIDRADSVQSAAEVERHHVTRLIFSEDRRFMEAHALLEPLRPAVAEYRPDPRAEEAAILEGQKVLMQHVMTRTFSLPVGNSMIKYSSKRPLLTEKYLLFGFSTSCLMKPMGNVVTAERQNYSEEKFFWAFFNAGVAAGLSIAKDARGIDTSWIMYNKPSQLTNKHAGLLLGLGLNGHLKTIAKWLSFKYLTPKHTMTSVGLLLGLSASFMGTMDTLVTRLLSVHVTRMLPAGAAELNLSPYTQTTGLMGIGLLYYNTQHRRMSEVMLSEIEYVDEPDPSEPPDTLRDEAYRLAAGFALGFINLGKGKDLRGLHDMFIVERLMAVAVAPKATQDDAVARKIDVPDTVPQFDYVRPDIFLLRTLAKHLIMWDNIEASHAWILKNLPMEYRPDHNLAAISKLRSSQMPFFNILAGLLWSISLKFAGTGDLEVRNFLVAYLDQFIRINRLPALRYDSKLAKNTVRNCQDLLALSAATVMAGTGDLVVFRRLRSLHGRVSPDTPYGSHLAAHMAFGALFIAGGTHTFSTSNKAIASLICAFYPLYPTDVQDSKAHLQAFRHFWVLAAEPRCLIVRDVDTGRATSMPITVHMRSGEKIKHMAPILLPETHLIERIETNDVAFWPTTLDFVNNPSHLQSFRQHQTLHVRRRGAKDMYASTFSSTLVALNDTQSSRVSRLMWNWIFSLQSLQKFESADITLILPADPYSSTFLDSSLTVVDARLVLEEMGKTWKLKELWELRLLFEWAEGCAQTGTGRLNWLGRNVVERLKADVLDRGRRIGTASKS